MKSWICVLLASLAFEARAAEPSVLLRKFADVLVGVEKVRQGGLAQLDRGDDTWAICVSISTSYQLEFSDGASSFGAMTLDGELAELPKTVAVVFENEATLQGRMVEICSAMIGGQREGVDYQALAAEFPALQAQIGHNEKSIYELTPLVLSVALESAPGAMQGKLLMSAAEREYVLGMIEEVFAAERKLKTHSYLAASALLIADVLGRSEARSP